MRDYPRVCGGTSVNGYQYFQCEGLSPRMRGHLLGRYGGSLQGGTIPAYAGAPSGQIRRIAPGGDYPRVCGGTMNTKKPEIRRLGLSPRMRGHLDALRPNVSAAGTIPAYAGAPS